MPKLPAAGAPKKVVFRLFFVGEPRGARIVADRRAQRRTIVVKEHPVIIESSQPAPVFGRDGEPCPACGAPLAGDQRYCLHCGARRPEARLEFFDVLDADVRARSVPPAGPFGAVASPFGGGEAWAAASGSPFGGDSVASWATVSGPPLGGGPVSAWGAAPVPPRGLNGRLQANAGLLALAALLLLTLLIGLLLGHWATGTSSVPSAATPAPQVIKVEGTAATPAAAATTTDGGSGGSTSGSGSSKSSSKAKAKSKSGDKATPDKDAVSVKSLSNKKAVDDAVKKGKPIATGTGKLPPKDDKAPAGGTGFEEIG